MTLIEFRPPRYEGYFKDWFKELEVLEAGEGFVGKGLRSMVLSYGRLEAIRGGGMVYNYGVAARTLGEPDCDVTAFDAVDFGSEVIS